MDSKSKDSPERDVDNAFGSQPQVKPSSEKSAQMREQRHSVSTNDAKEREYSDNDFEDDYENDDDDGYIPAVKAESKDPEKYDDEDYEEDYGESSGSVRKSDADEDDEEYYGGTPGEEDDEENQQAQDILTRTVKVSEPSDNDSEPLEDADKDGLMEAKVASKKNGKQKGKEDSGKIWPSPDSPSKRKPSTPSRRKKSRNRSRSKGRTAKKKGSTTQPRPNTAGSIEKITPIIKGEVFDKSKFRPNSAGSIDALNKDTLEPLKSTKKKNKRSTSNKFLRQRTTGSIMQGNGDFDLNQRPRTAGVVEKVKDPLLEEGDARKLMYSTWSPDGLREREMGRSRTPPALGCHEFIPHRIPSAKTRVPLHDHKLVMNSKQDVNLKIAECFMDSPLIQSAQNGPLFSEMSSQEFADYEKTKREKKKKRKEAKKRRNSQQRPRTMEAGRVPLEPMAMVAEEERPRPRTMENRRSEMNRSRRQDTARSSARSSRSPSPRTRSLLSMSMPQMTRTYQGSMSARSKKNLSRPTTCPAKRSNDADLLNTLSSTTADRPPPNNISLMSASLPLNKELMESKPSRLDKINKTAKENSFYRANEAFSPISTRLDPADKVDFLNPPKRKTSRRQQKLQANPSLYGPFAGRKDVCPTVRRLREILAKEKSITQDDGFSSVKLGGGSSTGTSLTHRPDWNSSTFLFEGRFTGGGPHFGTGRRQSISKRSTLMQHGRTDPAFNISRKYQKQQLPLNLPRNTVEEEHVFQKVMRMADLMNDVNVAVKNINSADVVELGTMRRPGKTVELVVEALCVIFGLKNPSWKTAQKLLLRNSYTLLGLMGSLDVGSLPAERREKLEKYINHPLLRQETVAKSSQPCVLICAWIQAVYNLAALRAGEEEGPESGVMPSVPLTPKSGYVSSRRSSVNSQMSKLSTLSLTQRVGNDDTSVENQGEELIRACQLNQFEVVEELLHPQANQDDSPKHSKSLCNFEDSLGRSSLHWAVDGKMTNLLVENGADIDQQDKVGGTPLMMACRRGHVEVVEALVKAGADVTITDMQGKRAGESFGAGVHMQERSLILSLLAGAIKFPRVCVLNSEDAESLESHEQHFSKPTEEFNKIASDVFQIEEVPEGDENIMSGQDGIFATEVPEYSAEEEYDSDQKKKDSGKPKSTTNAKSDNERYDSTDENEAKPRPRVSFQVDDEVFTPMAEEEDLGGTTDSHVRFVDNGVERFDANEGPPLNDGFQHANSAHDTDESEWSGEDYDEQSNSSVSNGKSESLKSQNEKVDDALEAVSNNEKYKPEGSANKSVDEPNKEGEGENLENVHQSEDNNTEDPVAQTESGMSKDEDVPLSGRSNRLPPKDPAATANKPRRSGAGETPQTTSRRSSITVPNSSRSSRRRESETSLGTFQDTRTMESQAEKDKQKFALVAAHVLPEMNGRFWLVFLQNEHSVILLIQDDAQKRYTHFIGASKDEIRSWLHLPTDGPVNLEVWSQVCQQIMAHLQCVNVGDDEGFYFGLEIMVGGSVQAMKMQPLSAPPDRFPKLPFHTEEKPVFIAQVEGTHHIVGMLSICLQPPAKLQAYLLRRLDGGFVASEISLSEFGYGAGRTLDSLDHEKIHKLCWRVLKGIRVDKGLEISLLLDDEDEDNCSKTSKESSVTIHTFSQIPNHQHSQDADKSDGYTSSDNDQQASSGAASRTSTKRKDGAQPGTSENENQDEVQVGGIKRNDDGDKQPDIQQSSPDTKGSEDEQRPSHAHATSSEDTGPTASDQDKDSGKQPAAENTNPPDTEGSSYSSDEEDQNRGGKQQSGEESEKGSKDGTTSGLKSMKEQGSNEKLNMEMLDTLDSFAYSSDGESGKGNDASVGKKGSVEGKGNGREGSLFDDIKETAGDGIKNKKTTDATYSEEEEIKYSDQEEENNQSTAPNSGKNEESSERYSSGDDDSEKEDTNNYQDNSSSFGPVEIQNSGLELSKTSSVNDYQDTKNESEAETSTTYSDDDS